ncbi:hypothetical protein TNCV_868031 [Trichonephila clavipes]|nr:hypothetical protein TNCV_868031 [Trichonephila clavipes]
MKFIVYSQNIGNTASKNCFKNFEKTDVRAFDRVNDTDIAGHSQNVINFTPSTIKENDSTNNDNSNTINSLPPPAFLKIEKHCMEQVKTLTKIIPTLRSKKIGELIKLYTNNFEDYRILNDTVEELKYQFFVIKPKHERPIKVVVKGLPKDTETQQIHQNLIDLGFTVDSHSTGREDYETISTSLSLKFTSQH